MFHIKNKHILKIVFLCSLFFGLFAFVVQGSMWSFDDAFSFIESDIKKNRDKKISKKYMKRQVDEPSRKNTVQFELKLNENGEGYSETKKKCFGVKLQCSAKILDPEGIYKIKVESIEESVYEFPEIGSNKPIEFTLSTNSGLKNTTFKLWVKKLSGENGRVILAMDYQY